MSDGQKKKMALLWTSHEDNILIDMVLNDKTVNEITTAFPNRVRDSIAGRIRRLRAAGKLPAVEKKPNSNEGTKARKARKTKRNESAKHIETTSASYVESTIGSKPSAKKDECTSTLEPTPKKPKKPKEPPYIPPERPLHPLERIGHKDCRWPMGDPRNEGFHFCGQPVESGFPYCREHTLKAFASGVSKLREELEVA